ncbi:MAG: mycofactocin biosynthesis glycosyltransferase MftF [Actinomycetes bacterium]
MRFTLDRTARRVSTSAPGLLAGSPLRWFRLTPTGDEVLDRLIAGDDLPVSGTVGLLVDRLVDAGAIHPQFEPGSVSGVDVTLVVPVRDRVDELAALLGSVAAGGAVPAHIVVVDDGSADAAAVAALAADFGATLVRRDRSGGPAAARNDGLAAVRTAFVVFVDSDCTVTSGWLDELVCAFTDDRVALAAARVVAAGGTGPLAEFDRLRSPLDLGPYEGPVVPGSSISYVPAAALAGRTEVLRTLGGFDDSLQVGEDVDLVWRVVAEGYRVRYRPTSQVEHPPRPSVGAWCRQRFQYGTSAAALDARHPGDVAPVRCSPWTVALWCAVCGLPAPLGVAIAGGIASVTGVSAAQRLAASDVPVPMAWEVVGRGHLGAGAQLARAVVRAWWPVALMAAVVSKRGRRVVAGALLWNLGAALAERSGEPVRAVPFAALSVIDDVAYGAGVWAGCIRRRSLRALLPSVAPSTRRVSR